MCQAFPWVLGANPLPLRNSQLTVWECPNACKAFQEAWRDFSCMDALSVPLSPGGDIQAPCPHAPRQHSRPPSLVNACPSRPLFFLFWGSLHPSAFAAPWTLTPASLCPNFPALLPGPARVGPPPPPGSRPGPWAPSQPCCRGHGCASTWVRPCLTGRTTDPASAGLGLGLRPLCCYRAVTGLPQELPRGTRLQVRCSGGLRPLRPSLPQVVVGRPPRRPGACPVAHVLGLSPVPLEETPEGLLTPCEAGGGGSGQRCCERLALVVSDLNPYLTVDALGVKLVVPQSCPAFSVAQRCLWTSASTAADLRATLRAGPAAQSLRARGGCRAPGGVPTVVRGPRQQHATPHGLGTASALPAS